MSARSPRARPPRAPSCTTCPSLPPLMAKLLSQMESLLALTGGRYVFAASASSLSVSLGVTRLAAVLADLLSDGSVHGVRRSRGGDSDPDCVPFVVQVTGADGIAVGSEKRSPKTRDDVERLLRERTIEGRLGQTIEPILLADPAILERHFEEGAFLRQAGNAVAVLEAARAFENNDTRALTNLRLGRFSGASEDHAAVRRTLSLPYGDGGVATAEGNFERLGARPKLVLNGEEAAREGEAVSEDEADGGRVSVLGSEISLARRPPGGGHRRTASDSSIQVAFFGSSSVGSPNLQRSDEMLSPAPLPLPEPPTSGWRLPRPESSDQTLASYISSGSFSRHQAQLDRENAHMILAEAIIQTMNKLNFETRNGLDAGLASPSRNALIPSPPPSMSDCLPVSAAPAPPSSSSQSIQDLDDVASMEEEELIAAEVSQDDELLDVESAMTDATEEDDFEASPLPSGASAASTSNRPARGHQRYNSAESIALSLLQAGVGANEPKVADLEWLVGDGDTPQKTLPLPTDFSPTSPTSGSAATAAAIQDAEFGDSTELRGSLDWAPPRAQLILKVHEKTKVASAMRSQSFRCAGCSLPVEVKYMKTFRFCAYFGKYFCTSCHAGSRAVLPARVVHKWDFGEQPVSDFGASVIASLADEPLFCMDDLNPAVVKRVSRLRQALQWRRDAAVIFPFIVTCKEEGEGIKSLLEKTKSFTISQPEVLSLTELKSIKSGSYVKTLKEAVEESRRHVLGCRHCHRLGHICEGCHSDDVLFPFQPASDVSQCEQCKACFHTPCYENLPLVTDADGDDERRKCSKCERIRAVREARRRALPHEEEEEEEGND